MSSHGRRPGITLLKHTAVLLPAGSPGYDFLAFLGRSGGSALEELRAVDGGCFDVPLVRCRVLIQRSQDGRIEDLLQVPLRQC